MELLHKLERTILGWVKDVPHLPVGARKWLADNIWWIVAIGAVLSGISVLVLLSELFSYLSTLSSPIISYYASATFVGWLVVITSVSLAFAIIECLLLAFAVTPLKEKQKKGWVLLFDAWLFGVLSVLVVAVSTLNIFSFLGNIIFGAVWIAITGYFLFEIHGQFAHVERSKGVKKKTA